MSVLKNLFSKKTRDGGETSGDLSLGAPDASLDPMAATTRAAALMAADDEGPESLDALEQAQRAELVSVPFLGRRTIGAHQRILFGALAASLVVLGSVAVYAVTQADKVAQQVKNTGDSLMQSQRLAKSVSQALVGSPQAFPEVKDSASVLARSVRGLKDGDE